MVVGREDILFLIRNKKTNFRLIKKNKVVEKVDVPVRLDGNDGISLEKAWPDYNHNVFATVEKLRKDRPTWQNRENLEINIQNFIDVFRKIINGLLNILMLHGVLVLDVDTVLLIRDKVRLR